MTRSSDRAMKPPVIGITGGVGSGKSTVARMLGELGCLVVNSDDFARAVLREQDVRETLRRWWGDAVLDAHGEVDRSAVARIVFNDPAERSRLESLIHPMVEQRRRDAFEAANPPPAAFVIDAPLLIEAGIDRECDHVIFVEADRTTRLERIAATRGWDDAELMRREAAQAPLDTKRQRGNSIVFNDGDLDSLREQVRSVFERIMKEHHRRVSAD